ncbi:hypothetical protein [Novosphingobium endophyticum]|uniref:hypothetical protein n=1 Tax=Novosphingobium endophyticum TaxID=1955250 RepID=UPI00166923A3|nr:hypothetical protein [Novosphingobium endophyticum]
MTRCPFPGSRPLVEKPLADGLTITTGFVRDGRYAPAFVAQPDNRIDHHVPKSGAQSRLTNFMLTAGRERVLAVSLAVAIEVDRLYSLKIKVQAGDYD